jgi:ABC-type sugar transport system permease subunit
VILGFNTAVLLAWRLMLNTGTGIINQLIRAVSQAFPPFGYLSRALIFAQELTAAFFLGLSNGKFNLLTKVWEAGFPAANRVPLWVQSPLWSKMSVVLLMIWGCGAMMLIFLAGLKNIPRELHEAAEVDGANSWKRFWKISFPLLTPYIFYNLVVGLINSLQIFEPIFVLYRDNQPLVPSAISMVYYLWQASFRHFEIGYGSAISWLILLIILVVTVVQFKMQDRWVHYDLY